MDYESTLKVLVEHYLDVKDPIRKKHPRLAKLAELALAVTPATVTTRESPEVGATSATPVNPVQRVLRPVIPPATSAAPANPAQRVRPVIPPATSAAPPVIPPATSAAPAIPAQRVLRPVIPRTLTSSRKNFVLKQHSGQCAHHDDTGKRCTETRWLHVHHRKPRAEGGTHTIENLTILCAAHHRMEHGKQTGFEFE